MPDLYASLAGFHAELEKQASLADFVVKNKGMLGSAGALAGHGSAAGALLGGLYGGYQSYNQAKDEGAGSGEAGVRALGGGIGGASKGAIGGALIGGGAGAALSTLRPQAGETVRKFLSSEKSPIGAIGRFGQRQMHGLTGWEPPEGMSHRSIRGGSWATQQAVNNAKDPKALSKATSTHAVQQEVERKGLTSIPGVVGALRGPERGEAAKLLAKHTWKNADSPMWKTLLLAGPASAAVSAMAPEQENGPGKGEQIGHAIGSAAGTIAGSALPVVGNMAVGSLGSAVGRYTGKAIDFARGRRSHTDASEYATNGGQQLPVERGQSSSVSEGMQ